MLIYRRTLPKDMFTSLNIDSAVGGFSIEVIYSPELSFMPEPPSGDVSVYCTSFFVEAVDDGFDDRKFNFLHISVESSLGVGGAVSGPNGKVKDGFFKVLPRGGLQVDGDLVVARNVEMVINAIPMHAKVLDEEANGARRGGDMCVLTFIVEKLSVSVDSVSDAWYLVWVFDGDPS